MKFKTTYNQFISTSIFKTLRTGPGQIHAIIATCTASTAETITLYDNTAASGNVLLTLACIDSSPLIIFFPDNMPLQFSTGLTVVTSTNTYAFLILAY